MTEFWGIYNADLEEQSEDLHDRGIDTSEGGNRGEPTEPLDGFDAIMKEAGWGDEDDERIDKAQAEPGRQAKRAQVERPHLQAAIQPGSSTLGISKFFHHKSMNSGICDEIFQPWWHLHIPQDLLFSVFHA